MKVINILVKLVIALAAVAGVVYVAATYGEQIVAWAKRTLARFQGMGGCPDAEEADFEEAEDCQEPAEEAPAAEEIPEEAPVAEEVSVEEAPAGEAEIPDDAPAAAEEDFEA